MLRIEKLLAPIIKYAALFIGMLSILKIWTRKSENLAVAKDDLKEANQGVDDAIKTNEIETAIDKLPPDERNAIGEYWVQGEDKT